MKVFQMALRSCGSLGFGPNQLTTRKYPINRKNLQALSILCATLSLSCAYFFIEANTFEEYALSVNLCVSLIVCVAVYFIFIWKNQSICDLLENFESTVNESKLNFTWQILF